MSVYVDDMRAPFGRLVMCHMVADTHRELVEMADRIGVARKWIQQAGKREEHFDICLAKRALAVRNGAIELDTRELARMTGVRRGAEARDRYFESSAPTEGNQRESSDL